MKRRAFFGTAAVGVASATTLGSCQEPYPSTLENSSAAEKQTTVQWRMAATWTKSVDIVFGASEILSERVKAMTDGRFTITPYEAGEIVPGLGVFDAVKDGTVECGNTAGYLYADKNPVFGFGAIPFGLNAQQQNAWIYYGGGLETLHKIYADHGIITFPIGNTGVQMGGWFKQPVNTVADLQGIKMRIPGFGAQVMNRLGMEPVSLSADGIFPAMESGEIDAVEFAGPYDDEKLGLYNLASYYYYPGWWEPGALIEVFVNLDAWHQLPTEYQEVFKSAAAEANLRMLARYDAENGTALQRLISRGTKLQPFSVEIMQAARAAARELNEALVAQSPAFREIYEQWNTFRAQIYQWNRINELSFADFAFNISEENVASDS